MRHAASAAYTPNADLASLLGHSIDQRNSLLDTTGFVGYQQGVKPEPFDGYLAIGHIAHHGTMPITSDGAYQLVQPSEYISYAPMMSVTMPTVVTMHSSTGSPEQVLPVCPVPTEKTIDVFYSNQHNKQMLQALYVKLANERYMKRSYKLNLRYALDQRLAPSMRSQSRHARRCRHLTSAPRPPTST